MAQPHAPELWLALAEVSPAGQSLTKRRPRHRKCARFVLDGTIDPLSGQVALQSLPRVPVTAVIGDQTRKSIELCLNCSKTC